MLVQRVKNVAPSMTMAITAMANELKAQGEDVIGLGAGEPDFKTPDYICEAAIKAMREGHMRYTAVDGTKSLKQAVIDKFAEDNQLNYDLTEVMVSTGAKQAIYNLCQAVLETGSEAIIPSPYWVSYPDMVKLADGSPVIVKCEAKDDFKITAEKLRQAITPQTKLFFLNSPSNPTGRTYSAEELSALAEVLREHPQIIILSDDIYEYIVYGDTPFCNILNVAPDLRSRTMVVNGVSKAYAMTGWRIGYCAADKQLIGAMKKIQSQSTSNPCSVSQYAAEEALRGNREFVDNMVKVFAERNIQVSKRLQLIDGISVEPATGAFYLFADINQAMQKMSINSDIDFVAKLLEQQKVAVVPGTPFGCNGFMRISFATALEDLLKACDRIQAFCEA